jgi:hypothetical protein
VCKNNDVTPMNEYWLYDKYVEKFIMDSEIYYTDNDEHTIMLTCADLESQETKQLFMQTLHYAVMNNTLDYLAPHPYYYQVDIQKPLSPFVIYQLKCKGVNLVLTRKELLQNHSDGVDSGLLMDYFHHELIHALTGKECKNSIFTENDSNEQESENVTEESKDYTTDFYLDEIIYRYLTNQMVDIDKEKLIPYMLRVDCYTYLTMPLVMYIVMKYYDSYFEKTEL